MTPAKNSRSASTSEEEPPRKRLRKGTHSCLECRRRKIRCIFKADDSAVCAECAARGVNCVGQEYEDSLPDHRKNLRDRVGRLESLVGMLVHKAGASDIEETAVQPPASRPIEDLVFSLPTPASTASDSSSRTPGLYETAPVLSLFDNAVLTRRGTERDSVPPDAGITPLRSMSGSFRPSLVLSEKPMQSFSSGDGKVNKTLLSTLPSLSDLDTIFDVAGGWWTMWRELFPNICDPDEHASIGQFVARALSQSSTTLIANALICIALSIQQLPADFDRRRLNLPLPADDLMMHYMSLVHGLIVSDDELAGTLEGIECMILQAKWHVNVGQPRRGWLILRRALSFAQLMGLHRLPKHSAHSSSAVARRIRSIWWTLYPGDRFISLLLGLPYAVADSQCDLDFDDRPVEWAASAEQYRRRLAVITGHVVDRNQTPGSPNLSTTLAIDQKLDNLARRMPDSWWHATSAGSDSAGVFYDRLIAQFWHYQVKALLHLPFLLESLKDRRYDYSRLLCLESSREMLRRYHLLRGDPKTRSYPCKLIDFQGFTAAVLLLLNLHGCGSTPSNQATAEQREDWRMVDETMFLLRGATSEVGSMVATQAVRVLETLHPGYNGNCNAGCSVDGQKIIVPFFGTISIGPGKEFRLADGQFSESGGLSANDQLPLPSGQLDLSATPPRGGIPLTEDPAISFNSFFPSFSAYPGQLTGEAPLFSEATNLSWQSIIHMDLDQDWNYGFDGSALPGFGISNS